jgi:hypothetical protein
MNSLPEPDLAEPLPAQDGSPARPELDPYEALDDLMTVVESLCPVWPDKDIPRVTVGFLL